MTSSVCRSMDSLFGPEGVLARSIDGYEFRAGQLEMARAVAQCLAPTEEEPKEGCSSLVVEAETGLGKTLAYLIPAVLSGARVVVSTNTRNLQDQILEKEIPLIREHIDPHLQALCVKGRQNYLCLYRFRQLQAASAGELFAEGGEALDRWIAETIYADRSELPWLAASSLLWQKICCQSHFCLGPSCPEATGCFLNRLRRDAGASRLLIVNHHLLFSDLAVRRTGYGEVLPRYETVIFDEAHHVENVATTFFGFTLSRYQMLDLVGDLERTVAEDLAGKDRQAVSEAAVRLSGTVERWTATFPSGRGRFPLPSLLGERADVLAVCEDLGAALEHLATVLDSLAGREGPWPQYAGRAQDLASRLQQLLASPEDNPAEAEIRFTRWYERTERNLTLCVTPVDVAEELRATLFAMTRHCVFTSATLTAGGRFTYFLDRLGLPEDTPTLSLPSPFDYRQRTLLYVPATGFPEPAAPGYQSSLHTCMETLINHAGGRTLALFTSFQAMETAYHVLRDRVPFPLLVQGEAPRRVLLDQFARRTESVLCAVASFWEGVDIPGEALSLVIIDKLPFEVPSDPVIMARINRIRAQGGNPFADFQVPRAILTLRQGVGRLMRTCTDRGVVAILDARLFTKGYGRQFLRSLPPSPITRELAEVASFFRTDDETE